MTYETGTGELGRLKTITEGTSLGSQASTKRMTEYLYDDGPPATVTTKRDLNSFGDAGLVSETQYDGLGRPVSTSVQETESTGILTTTEYDALGRVWKKSNPVRSTPGDGDQTRFTYDEFGWAVAITYPDGSTEAHLFSGNQETVTDAAGAKRVSTFDGLGRLASLVEDPAGALNYTTSYLYDTLGNLTSVTQGTQQRTFAYDSLSRLVCASNPEARVEGTPAPSCLAGTPPSSGVLRYTYDANGNLATKKDAREVTTTYSYDVLNRLRLKSYAEPAPPPGEPAIPHAPNVTYCYDGKVAGGADGACVGSEQEFFAGRISEVSSTAAKTTYVAYDALGRVAASKQTLPGVAPFTFGASLSVPGYRYNLADGLTELKLPSGRTISYGYDAAGRVQRITGTLGTTTKTYANAITYWPHGAINVLPLGGSAGVPVLRQTDSYNNRLQLTSMTAMGSEPTPLRKLEYDYNAGRNNGNVRWQRLTGTAGLPSGTTLTQYYAYDAVNRLTTSVEQPQNPSQPVCPDATSTWCRTQAYDQWGNGWVAQWSGIPPDSFTPQSGSAFDGRNRLTSAAYDAAGNLTQVGAWGFSYDGENRQREWTVTANGVTTTARTYDYDGDGRRVQQTASGATKTLYVYDALGQLAVEYTTASGAAAPPCATCYVITDHLGSTRLVTDDQGVPKRAYDYLPFGEEIPATIGGRGPLYTGDNRCSNGLPAKNEIPRPASIISGLGTSRGRRGGSRVQIRLPAQF